MLTHREIREYRRLGRGILQPLMPVHRPDRWWRGLSPDNRAGIIAGVLLLLCAAALVVLCVSGVGRV